jgi:YbbR domain-containing protein
MENIMRKRFMLIIILLAAFLFVSVSGNAGNDFAPVQIRTKALTMTGVRQAPSAEEPRDYQFTPVSIRTKTLTMTGTRD